MSSIFSQMSILMILHSITDPSFVVTSVKTEKFRECLQ